MKYTFLALITFVLSCQQEIHNRININIPSAQSETAYVWRTIQDIKFFEEHNYQVSLPQGDLIKELKRKSKLDSLTNADYKQLEQFMVDSMYTQSDYQKGHEKIKNELALINQLTNQLSSLNYNWNFKTYDLYQINLTLYGPGGSYNPDEGSVLIFTTPDGQFKSYDNPAFTIIHEIVHIGIEESIVSKYNVPHALKERIVDTFVSLKFGKDLPGYRVQNMGDNRTDKYLKEIDDLKNLDKIVEKVLK